MLLMSIGWTPVHLIDPHRLDAIKSNAYSTATSPAKGKKCVGHSPTQNKRKEMTPIRVGAR